MSSIFRSFCRWMLSMFKSMSRMFVVTAALDCQLRVFESVWHGRTQAHCDGSRWRKCLTTAPFESLNWFTQIRLENCKAARWTKPALPHSEHGLLFPIAARRGTRVGGAHVLFGKVFGLESQHRRKCACFQPRCSLDGSLTTCLLLHEMQWKLSKWRMLWTHCTR